MYSSGARAGSTQGLQACSVDSTRCRRSPAARLLHAISDVICGKGRGPWGAAAETVQGGTTARTTAGGSKRECSGGRGVQSEGSGLLHLQLCNTAEMGALDDLVKEAANYTQCPAAI